MGLTRSRLRTQLGEAKAADSRHVKQFPDALAAERWAADQVAEKLSSGGFRLAAPGDGDEEELSRQEGVPRQQPCASSGGGHHGHHRNK